MTRLRAFVVLVGLLAFPVLAHAQAPSYDVGFWLAATVDPNVTAPVAAPVNYTALTCGLTKTARTTALVISPNGLRFDDPANPSTLDCAITITTQVGALPNDMTQYRASARQVISGVAGPWAALSSDPFARNPPPAALTRVGVS